MRFAFTQRGKPRAPLACLTLAASAALLSGCVSTMPTLGGNKGVVSGAAGGESVEGENSSLDRCTESLGTVALDEDTNAHWYSELRSHRLGSTVPVLRLMIQQSNCFVIVERGKSLNNMMRERDLARGEESRAGSNFQKGQMVAADYTMSPSVQFAANTGGGGAGLTNFGNNLISRVAGSVKRNEASTTLLLIDNRSGVQISAAEGTAGNFDFGIFGAAFGGSNYGAAGAYGKTPQGKVVVASFADSFNQMVKSLRRYKAQTVKGGLGTGGRLGVQGGDTAASREVGSKAVKKK